MVRHQVRWVILALGVTQVIGYGGLYYAFAVLAPEITREFGWASGWTYGAFSVGLLAGGLVAPLSGRLIDRYGAPTMMAIGSVLAAASLVGLSQSHDLMTFYLAITVMEVVSTLVLYDAAFTMLTQFAGRDARSAITKLTLIAGFASTIFWPLTVYLLTLMPWREVYLVYAALCLFVCAPLHAVFRPALKNARTEQAVAKALADSAPAEGGPASPPTAATFWLVAIFFATGGFIVSALSVHMLTILQSVGFAAGVATLISMLQGPSQVAARLVEFTFARRLSPQVTSIVSAALIPLGLAFLGAAALGPAAGACFAIAYGAGLGLNSIVRGTLPLALFGPHGYGALMGRLSAPGLVVKSAAPFAFALVADQFGTPVALIGLGLVAVISLVSVLLLPRTAPTGGSA